MSDIEKAITELKDSITSLGKAVQELDKEHQRMIKAQYKEKQLELVIKPTGDDNAY